MSDDSQKKPSSPETPSRKFITTESYGALTYIFIASIPLICINKSRGPLLIQAFVWGLLLIARLLGENLFRAFYTPDTVSVLLTIFHIMVACMLLLCLSTPGLYVNKTYDFQPSTTLCDNCKYFHRESPNMVYCEKCKLCHFYGWNHCTFTGKCTTPWNVFFLVASMTLTSILVYFWGYFYFNFVAGLVGIDLHSQIWNLIGYKKDGSRPEMDLWTIALMVMKFQAFIVGISLFVISIIVMLRACGVLNLENDDRNSQSRVGEVNVEDKSRKMN
jgi:hypothetical protein